MTVYAITGFSPGPHWEMALIEADSEDEARGALLAILRDEEQRPDTVWGWTDGDNPVCPPESWRVQVARQPLRFVLGGGCR